MTVIDPATLTGNWNYPTRVLFGPGRIRELAGLCRELGMQRPLLVTDPGLAGLPFVRDALAANRTADLPTGLCTDVRPNPTAANVTAGVAAYREGGHDGVVALGGGSALDVGKAVALMVGQQRPIWDFEDIGDNWTRADASAIPPILAVPTTAGTGSEVGRCSVVTHPDEHRKVVIFHPRMMPTAVLADPALTVGLPPGLTAGVGMDALSHNLEAYCAPGFHPAADGIAAEGIRLVHRSLTTAVRDGTNLPARAEMLAAATMGATAFQKGLGAMHSLSHPVGATLDTHHGLTNGVVMPYVLTFNRPAIEDRICALSRLLDLPGQDFDAFHRWILELRSAIGVPHTLAELGVTEAMIPEMAASAVVDPTAATNPIPLTVDNLSALYRAALAG